MNAVSEKCTKNSLSLYGILSRTLLLICVLQIRGRISDTFLGRDIREGTAECIQ